MSAPTGIVVAADFTADPIVDTLDFWRRQFGWEDEVRLAPYNQVIQTLLDPAGRFAENGSGVNVVLLREEKLSADFTVQLNDAISRYWGRGGAPLVIALCPSRKMPEAGKSYAVLERDSVYVIASAEILKRYPVTDPFDEHAQALGDVPYRPLFFAALGSAVARRIHAIRMRPYKVIALDCDNTLWQGTCGEDGPEGVVLDGPRRYLQNFMRERRDTGMLLALASKNNKEDVVETFRAHPEMPLQWDDFVANAIDWRSKGIGFAQMAQGLKLGLDSFVFVDDSAKEIGEVQAAFPEVVGLTLPHEEARIPHFLDHAWVFDQLRVTQEDRERNQSYREQLRRGEVEKMAQTLGDFVDHLQVDIHIDAVKLSQVARVAQLTQRTNQMNTTLVRRNEGQIGIMVETNPAACLTVDVTDRFGSYGLVGVLFLTYAADAIVIENLLLSCRALGRGVEQRMLQHVGQLALAMKKSFVDIAFVEGPRNKPAREFLSNLPSEFRFENSYRLCAEVCASLRYQPDATVELIQETPKAPSAGARPFQDYGKIARDLSNPSQILEAIEAEKRERNTRLTSTAPPRTELERTLAALWAEVLHIQTPGREDDFFDLGGHSLLAVQLLSRVRQELGVELSLDLVYTGKMTVSSMAAAVELAQADPEEIDRLLAEIDTLSEEELRALLESEEA